MRPLQLVDNEYRLLDFFIWDIDPVLISFAGISIHWYGALFASAILCGFQVVKWIYVRENKNVQSLDNLLVYAVVGIIVGARLAHCLFYDPQYYFANPLKIFAIWEGGLASHGGGLGVILAVYFYQKKFQISYLWLLDRLAIATALFGFFVRIANFVNSEIVGHPTNVPWAVVFAKVDMLPRHPAQLYEAISYLAIFVLLAICYRYSDIKRHVGALFGLFLCLIFSARLAIEVVKVKQAAYINESLMSTGQLLSVPFMLVGVFLLARAYKNRDADRASV